MLLGFRCKQIKQIIVHICIRGRKDVPLVIPEPTHSAFMLRSHIYSRIPRSRWLILGKESILSPVRVAHPLLVLLML